MKRLNVLSVFTVAVLLLTIVAGCAQPQQAASGKKFVIASDATWPPMEYVDESKNIVGFEMDLIAAIAKDQGFTYEIKNTAWDGIFAGLSAGNYDAVMSSVTITDDRKKDFDFSDPYAEIGQGVVVRAGETQIKSKDDLKSLPEKSIGAQIGTTGAFEIENLNKPGLKQYDTIDVAMLDLKNGNLRAVVTDWPVAGNYALVSPAFKGLLKLAGDRFTNEQAGLVVKKGDPQKFLPLFNAGLKNLKSNGTYDTIYQKWIGTKPS